MNTVPHPNDSYWDKKLAEQQARDIPPEITITSRRGNHAAHAHEGIHYPNCRECNRISNMIAGRAINPTEGDLADRQGEILDAILEERGRQDIKWGFPQRHSLPEWIAVLTEEVGEAAQEALRVHFGGKPSAGYREEVIQVAAVCVAMLEELALSKNGRWVAGEDATISQLLEKIPEQHRETLVMNEPRYRELAESRRLEIEKLTDKIGDLVDQRLQTNQGYGESLEQTALDVASGRTLELEIALEEQTASWINEHDQRIRLEERLKARTSQRDAMLAAIGAEIDEIGPSFSKRPPALEEKMNTVPHPDDNPMHDAINRARKAQEAINELGAGVPIRKSRPLDYVDADVHILEKRFDSLMEAVMALSLRFEHQIGRIDELQDRVTVTETEITTLDEVQITHSNQLRGLPRPS